MGLWLIRSAGKLGRLKIILKVRRTLIVDMYIRLRNAVLVDFEFRHLFIVGCLSQEVNGIGWPVSRSFCALGSSWIGIVTACILRIALATSAL